MNIENYNIVICIGSNCDRETNVNRAQLLLKQLLPDISFSNAIQTRPYSGGGEDYLNMLALSNCPADATTLQDQLKDIERRIGRRPEDKRVHRVAIDLDVLKVGNERYHLRDWEMLIPHFT